MDEKWIESLHSIQSRLFFSCKYDDDFFSDHFDLQSVDHGVQSWRNHMEQNGRKLPEVRQVREAMEDDDDVAWQQQDDVDGEMRGTGLQRFAV